MHIWPRQSAGKVLPKKVLFALDEVLYSISETIVKYSAQKSLFAVESLCLGIFCGTQTSFGFREWPGDVRYSDKISDVRYSEAMVVMFDIPKLWWGRAFD